MRRSSRQQQAAVFRYRDATGEWQTASVNPGGTLTVMFPLVLHGDGGTGARAYGTASLDIEVTLERVK